MTNPYGTPYPHPSMPPKKRPIWPWFLVGGGVLFLGIVAVLVLAVAVSPTTRTGVSNSDGGNVAAPAETSATPEEQRTEAGFRPLKVGEEASWGPNGGRDPFVKFTLTKIAVDPKCSPYMKRDAGKHTLLVDVAVQTLDFPDDSAGFEIAATLNPFKFQTRDAAGTTHSGSISICVGSSKHMPVTYSPNSKYTGQIEIEVEDKTGALLLARGFSNGSGWEWAY
ncbi:hypothetical protein BS329_16350 [Amycolatopsis coloradensis]|uniref:DUF4352 domain-containing protein n=1 Tax=Amycolatopsis coloradensis TaxID=76021 RepID=A0A1R0KTI4_9PSEU|nr:hypothetical protein [Amycolatopsis coloradensis]OLZ51367.1 hypothetical protein BS329_16350 [Amycolatopsis coloradensis]